MGHVREAHVVIVRVRLCGLLLRDLNFKALVLKSVYKKRLHAWFTSSGLKHLPSGINCVYYPACGDGICSVETLLGRVGRDGCI